MVLSSQMPPQSRPDYEEQGDKATIK